MTALELTIPAPCDWLNANQRLHRMVHAKRTAAWRNAADYYATEAAHDSFLEPVQHHRDDPQDTRRAS